MLKPLNQKHALLVAILNAQYHYTWFQAAVRGQRRDRSGIGDAATYFGCHGIAPAMVLTSAVFETLIETL